MLRALKRGRVAAEIRKGTAKATSVPLLLLAFCSFWNAATLSVKAQLTDNNSNAPFSLGYSLEYGPQLVGAGVASCEPGFGGIILGGHFNQDGDPGKNAVRWTAHLDAPGHIQWAARFGDDVAGAAQDLTGREDWIYADVNTGSNQLLVGKFNAETLACIKAVRVSMLASLNPLAFELHREPGAPVVTSLIEDCGDHFAVEVLSGEIEVAFNRTYVCPAFATTVSNAMRRATRCRIFRMQDGFGYDLVVTPEVQQLPGTAGSSITKMGIVRIGLDGSLKWGRLYSFEGGFGQLIPKITADSAIIAQASGLAGAQQPGTSLLVKIDPDGKPAWAKVFDAPGLGFEDFHCDATPYRFIQPNFKVEGADQSHGLPRIILMTLDYATGVILDQTRFPGTFSGLGMFSALKDNCFYLSTFGMEVSKSGIRRTASICRFDHRLRFLGAKEVLGAQSSFPLLTCGPAGINMLSHEYWKPFKGVGSAVKDDLEPVDVPCPWTKDLRLIMETSSYTNRDIECKEVALDVTVGQGAATVQADSFKLLPLALKVEKGGAEPPAAPDSNVAVSPKPAQPARSKLATIKQQLARFEQMHSSGPRPSPESPDLTKPDQRNIVAP